MTSIDLLITRFIRPLNAQVGAQWVGERGNKRVDGPALTRSE